MTGATGAPRGWRPVDPPQRPLLFINPASRGGTAARLGLGNKAEARGIRCVVVAPCGDPAALVREQLAGGVDAVGMAGERARPGSSKPNYDGSPSPRPAQLVW